MDIKKTVDIKLLMVMIFLLLFGILMSFSSSIYYSNKLVGNPFYFFNKQLLYAIISLVVAFFLIKVSMLKYKQYSKVLFAITLILLLLVFVPIIGGEIKGSYRWLNFGLFAFQPSEMMKIVFILFMARLLVDAEFDVKETIWGWLINTGLFITVVSLLLLFETDFGATIIIVSTAMAMLFIAHVKLRSFMMMAIIIAILLAVLISFFPERMARITAFLDPWSDPLGKGYQLIQSLIAIGNGGWFGTGIGSSVQKYNFLPDSHTDFVFAIIGEELGVIGMLTVLVTFSYIIYRGIKMSNEALKQGSKYNSYIAYGISIWFALQIFIHIGVNVGLLPTKGLTLPLFSYGGTSMLITVISLTILLRIDAENRYHYMKRGEHIP